jgi:stage III sporulation protein AG
MQKPKRKIHMLFIGTLLAIFIIFINTMIGSMGGEKEKGEESREFATLEQALMKIEGIGEVLIYPHYDQQEEPSPLSGYFSGSGTSSVRKNPLQGILVVAEGADNPRTKNELIRILSTVLQLPEHRIVVEEMKRGIHVESE